MNVEDQSKNSFSFNIKVLDRDINYKKIKDIFIRKQDIYLIKILERRAKNSKNKNLEPLKKIMPNVNKEKINLKYKTPKVIKLIDYKNIKINRKKTDNSLDNNYIEENKRDIAKNNNNQFEGLITSRIFNSDSSRNNIKMLNIQNEKYTNLQLYNDIFLKIKNENTNNKIQKKIINLKQNISDPYETFIKFHKKRDRNYTKYDKKLHNRINISTNYNNKMTSDKKANIKHKRIPIYRNNIFNKINLTENKNESYFDCKNKKESLFTKNKIIKFHKEFNLFKKEKKDKNIKNKIIFDNNKEDIGYIERNNSKKKINYSLNLFK